jgi:hypothetical protein
VPAEASFAAPPKSAKGVHVQLQDLAATNISPKAICKAIPMAMHTVDNPVSCWPGRSVKSVAEHPLEFVLRCGATPGTDPHETRHTLPGVTSLDETPKGAFSCCQEIDRPSLGKTDAFKPVFIHGARKERQAIRHVIVNERKAVGEVPPTRYRGARKNGEPSHKCC